MSNGLAGELEFQRVQRAVKFAMDDGAKTLNPPAVTGGGDAENCDFLVVPDAQDADLTSAEKDELERLEGAGRDRLLTQAERARKQQLMQAYMKYRQRANDARSDDYVTLSDWTVELQYMVGNNMRSKIVKVTATRRDEAEDEAMSQAPGNASSQIEIGRVTKVRTYKFDPATNREVK